MRDELVRSFRGRFTMFSKLVTIRFIHFNHDAPPLLSTHLSCGRSSYFFSLRDDRSIVLQIPAPHLEQTSDTAPTQVELDNLAERFLKLVCIQLRNQLKGTDIIGRLIIRARGTFSIFKAYQDEYQHHPIQTIQFDPFSRLTQSSQRRRCYLENTLT